MKLKDIMTKSVVVVPPSCTIRDAAEKMGARDIGAIPVCDGEKLLGMVTDRDIAINAVAKGLDPSQRTVRDIMNHPIVYAFDDTTVEEAVRIMEVKQIRRLVVVNHDKKLVGVVATADLARKTSEELVGEAIEKISEPASKQTRAA